MEDTQVSIGDYLEIVRRRKWSLILPALSVLMIAVIVALALPAVYNSTATILIEQQDIPSDFVMSSAAGYAEQRLQTINKRIMSSSHLLEVINQFNLYADLKDTRTTDEILNHMREDVSLDTLSAEVIDRRTGRAAAATIAFTLSYEGKNPKQVQQVTNMLTSMFLNENLKVGERQAAETATFFEKEMEKVKADLSVMENRIAVFKEANLNSLPDLLQVNLQSFHNSENQIDRLNEQLRSLKEKEGYLQLQLSNTSRDIPNMNPEEQRLSELKIQLTNLSATFSNEYPDVVKTKAEIAEIEQRMKLEKDEAAFNSETPRNPAYVTLASQLASTRADLESVKRQIYEYTKRVDLYRARIEATPRVEETYKSILIERDNLQSKFDDLMRKMMEARVAQGLEREQKGERFTLIDPARLPEKPDKPNRLAIVLIGVVLGLGAGVGFAAFREFTDDAVRNTDMLHQIACFPILATIPTFVSVEEGIRKRRNYIWAVTASILAVVLIVVVFHTQVMDLGLLWAKVAKRMG